MSLKLGRIRAKNTFTFFNIVAQRLMQLFLLFPYRKEVTRRTQELGKLSRSSATSSICPSRTPQASAAPASSPEIPLTLSSLRYLVGQCDQRGRYLKVLGNKLCYQSSQIFGKLFGLIEKHHV